MPKPHQRTRSKKRNPLKLPGSSAAMHYKRKRIGVSHCAQCGRVLPNIPRLTSSKLRSLTASKKRLQRMYGGQLCHVCLQEALRQAVRSSLTS
jgi:large subunit ribosomal protein L34e